MCACECITALWAWRTYEGGYAPREAEYEQYGPGVYRERHAAQHDEKRGDGDGVAQHSEARRPPVPRDAVVGPREQREEVDERRIEETAEEPQR